ncbi:hypothetical protein [Nocardia sp. NPDC051750]|uniref:hypothetical protein n=1 Tax=Nocardia sp. NPDC051750 TaxID=3364325 RepID=UPI00378D553A
MNFEEYLDGPVTLFGVAENSMNGAMLLCGARSVVYIDGLREWDAADVTKMFELSGTLVTEGDDDELHTADGAVGHGIGRHYVVKEASWERLS